MKKVVRKRDVHQYTAGRMHAKGAIPWLWIAALIVLALVVMMVTGNIGLALMDIFASIGAN